MLVEPAAVTPMARAEQATAPNAIATRMGTRHRLAAEPLPTPARCRVLTPTPIGPMNQDGAFCRNVARLGVEAADALDHAHGLGILHRDIKPANLMIDPHGALWITDFGLARVLQRSQSDAHRRDGRDPAAT